MIDTELLSFVALAVAAGFYIAGILYALREQGQKAAMLIVAGAVFTLAGML